MAAVTCDERPVQVLIDPKWNFELENFDTSKFLDEAKVNKDSIALLRSRFLRFCSAGSSGSGGGSGGAGSPDCTGNDEECKYKHLTQHDFHRLNEHYSLCPCEDEERFYRSLDVGGSGRLSFQNFLMGCAAANPSTPHILNSFTGYIRARYMFSFYDSNGSGTLSYEDLSRLLADARRNVGKDVDVHRQLVGAVAQELGEVSAITLRIASLAGEPVCDVRVSRHWTVHGACVEIAKQLQAPVEGLELRALNGQPLPASDVLEQVLPPEATSVSLSMVHFNLDGQQGPPASSRSDNSGAVVGIERLVHIRFARFYDALVSEQLRGTSRLFRFQRSLLHTKASRGVSGALGGA